MVTRKIRWNPGRTVPLLVMLVALPSVYAGTIWTDALPSNGNSGNDAAVPQGSFISPPTPYILGDQFNLSTATTITSVTVYAVDSSQAVSSTGTGATNDLGSISLYLGADSTALTEAASDYTSATQVQFGNGQNYDSLDSPGTYYPIFAVTFSGLSVPLGAGLNDFAVDGAGGTLYVLMSDPANSGTSEEDASTIGGGSAFGYFINPGSGWTLTYQYGPGAVSNYGGSGTLDADVIIAGTGAVPEPSTIGLLGIGLAGIWAASRRRARRRRA
jgi:hypothetical protein